MTSALPIVPISKILAATVAVVVVVCSSAALADNPPDFLRDVRPILAEFCFQCHGPDGAKRQAGLRLDRRESSVARLESGAIAIQPGNAGESALVRRIESTDPDVVMPPPEMKRQLSVEQKQLLRRWIEFGAPYSEHWAYRPPVRPKIPATLDQTWSRNEIDHFVLAKLESLGLRPSAVADPNTLIRRLSLDLTGLPPTIDDVDEFLADGHQDAYERLVDRLLASPHFGEKIAQDWLDLARFGDSSGYQDDGDRPNFPYRDYVIRAFNANMPFDQFTIENLAGDLLPNATVEQKVASGFNRLHRHNEEGGSDPDEFQVVYAVDRTTTTATTWMGLTFGCAQCHDHKYDPFSQREFFQLYAFFNSLKGEVVISKAASPPQIRVPEPASQSRHNQLISEIAKTERRQHELQSEVTTRFNARLREHFVAEEFPELRDLEKRLAGLRSQREEIERSFPLALIWEEMESPRLSRILERGDYQRPGEVVARAVPAIFPPLADNTPPDRLALARWLVSDQHPLTARVAVNRLWKQCFGTGLVRTPEDFGVRGEPPTHPELLDWLAAEFMGVQSRESRVESEGKLHGSQLSTFNSGHSWDMKRRLRLIVTSATYRQASATTPQLREVDPDNRWLARGARFRLSAEEIRDAVLTISGLLTRHVGGRSVYPYQPEHFYRDKEDDPGEWKWPVESGADLYRRGLYTFLRRTTPYPSYQMFDAPSRGECTVSRSRTNTPLQAMVTMNDPAFVEAARVLGEQIAMHTDPINHDPAVMYLQSGSSIAGRPCLGSWLSYGLGTENANMPAFVVLLSGPARGGQPLLSKYWHSGFLPGRHQGVQFRSAGEPVMSLSDPAGISRDDRRRIVTAVNELNRLKLETVGDPEIEARINAFELAFQMQVTVPRLMDLANEPQHILDMYGAEPGNPGAPGFANNCLLARRMIESGVRFIQLYDKDWDHHADLPKKMRLKCQKTDKACAALIQDLAQRGLLDDTLVVWGGEFGRTTYCQGSLTADNYGRDHHPRCFTVWLAGGGIKPGIVLGKTDDFSYNIAEDPIHVHDLQATILHCLGIDHERLTYRFQGRDYRLTDVSGHVVDRLLA